MPEISYLIKMLQDENHNNRFEACEELRVSKPPLPQEAIDALIIATKDSDPDVADAARRALALNTSNPIWMTSVHTETPSTVSDKFYKPLLLLSWFLYLPTFGAAFCAFLGLGWSGGVTEVSSSDLLVIFWYLSSPIIGFFLLMRAQNNYKNNNRDGIYFPLLIVILNSIFILFTLASELS